MKLRVLVFINALAVALSLGIFNYYFQSNWFNLLITFSITLVISFIVFYYLIERYVYSKIILIYKLIHNLKLGKDLKDALGEHVSDDPINDVEYEVKEWAKDKKKEIGAVILEGDRSYRKKTGSSESILKKYFGNEVVNGVLLMFTPEVVTILNGHSMRAYLRKNKDSTL